MSSRVVEAVLPDLGRASDARVTVAETMNGYEIQLCTTRRYIPHCETLRTTRGALATLAQMLQELVGGERRCPGSG